MFEDFFTHFFKSEGQLSQLLLLTAVAFHPIFNAPENHFHEDGLGTCPSTENPPENYREQYNKHQEDNHGQHKNEKVFRPENGSEQDKFPADNIKKKQGLPARFYEG